MADIESNIDININADQAISAIKQLQAQLSRFYQDLSKTSAKAAADANVLQSKLIGSINATGKFAASIQNVTTTTESFTNALERNKLSFGEYFKYGASQVTGFRKVFSTEFDTIDKVARERVKTLQTQYIKLGRDANGAMKSIAVRPLKLDMNDLGTQVAMTAQKQQLFNQLLQQGSTNLLNFGKNTQWAGRQLMVGFTIPLSIFGAAAAREFMKLEEQTLRFQKVYGDFSTTAAATDKMTESMRGLSTEFTKYGIAVEKTMGLAADAAAMGKTGADLVAQVSEATRLAVLGGVEQSQALETTTSLTNAFGVASDRLAGKINFLNAVENQTVTSIEDLTVAIPKAGPVVQQLGGNVEDLAFFMTAMKEGGIDAGEGANALKSGLASMINPTQEATDRLAEFGINLKGIVDANAGNVKNMIISLATELDNLSDINRAQAIEQLFGKFQFARMSTLFQNVIAEGSQAQRVLQLTQSTTEELAVLSERELKKIESSPMYQFQAAVEKFQAALAPVGESFLKAVTPIINFGTDILNKFNEMGDGAKQFWTVVIAAVAGLGPILLMTFGLIANGAANILKLFGMMGGVFTSLSGQSKLLGGSTQYMTNEQLEAASIAASLNQVHQNLIQTFTSEASAAYELAAAYRAAAVAGSGITSPMVPRAGGAAPKTKKYADGVVMVPGPKGAGDVVPAMLSPGEAVIPADKANKYGGLIQAMIDGTIPGYQGGKGTEFAHIGTATPVGFQTLADALQKFPNAFTDRLTRLITAGAEKFGNAVTLNTYGKLGFTTGTTPSGQSVNNMLGKTGVSSEDFLADWDKQGIERWNKSIRYAGLKMSDVSQELELLDSGMREYFTSIHKGANVVDADVERAYKYASKRAGAENLVVRQFNALSNTIGEARVNLSQAIQNRFGLAQAPGGGSKGAVMLGDMKVRRGGDKFPAYNSPGIPKDAVASGKNLGAAITKDVIDGVNQAADSKSPSRRAAKAAGKNIVDGALEPIENAKPRASKAGTNLVDDVQLGQSQSDALIAQEAAKQKRAKLAGRISGAGMAATVALGATSMVPGAIGEVSQQLLPVAGTVATILPMLISLGPVFGTLVAVVGGVTAGIIGLNVAMDGWRKESIKLNESISGSQKAIRSLAEFAGNVTAGEVADRQRENKFSRFQIQEGKQTFGESYLQSEAGAALVESIQKEIKSGGMDRVANDILSQMSTAVVSGAISAGQARSIVAEIASQLGDEKMGMDINGKLIEFLGPNGEDLFTDPIGVRLKIMEDGGETIQSAAAIFKKINDEAMFNPFSEWNWNMEKLSTTIGAGVSDQAIALQQNQEMLDSLDQEYRKRIEIAKAAGDTAEAARLTAELEDGRKEILKKNSEDIKSIEASYKNVSNYVRSEMDKAADQTIDQTYAGTAQQSSAELAKSAIKDAGFTNQQDYTMRVMLGTGDLNPTQVVEFLDVFGKDIKTRNAFFNITTDLGPASSSQALEIVNMMEDENLQKEFMLKLDAMPVGEAQQYMDMLAEVSKVGEVAEIEAILKFYAEDPDAGAELLADIQEFKDAQAAGPITLDVVQRVFGQDVADIVSSNWEYFNSLDKDMQLTYTQTIKTIYQTIGSPEFEGGIDSWLKEKGYKNKKGKQANFNARNGLTANETKWANEYIADQARRVTEASAQPVVTGDDTGAGDTGSSGGGGGGGRTSSFLDDLLQKLRKVQMATLGLTEGWAGARQALDNLFPGGASNSPFQGIEQQMRRLGAKEDLITLIAGMDPEEFQKRKDELFTFDAAGNITGFRNSLLSIGAALRSIKFGEFQSEQQKNVNIIKDQNEAIRKLIANGFSMAEAYDMVKDAAFASAIAQETNSEVIKKATEDYKKATAQAKLFAAAQAATTANQKVTDRSGILDFINANVGNLSNGVINEMLNNPDFATLIMSPNLTSEQKAALDQWIANIENQTELDLQVKLTTIEGMEQVFQDGFNKAMEAFSAQEKRIELEFAAKKDPFQQTIENAQNLISDIQNRPGGLDDLQADIDRIADKEQDINKKYKDRLSSLEQIKRSNDRIIQQRKAELSVADAITQGDIAAAARAIEDARAQQAQANMQAQQEMLQRQQQSEIDALTGQMGMTREQIETRIRDLKNEIFSIEENMLEPAQYQLSLLERQEKRQKEALTVLGMTRREWETLNNRIQVAKTSSEEYKKAMENARDVVGKIVEYWTEIQKPKTTVHTIITNYVTNGGSGAGNVGASGDGGGGGGSGNSGSSGSGTGSGSNTAAPGAGTIQQRYDRAMKAQMPDSRRTSIYTAKRAYDNALKSGTVRAKEETYRALDTILRSAGFNLGGLVPGVGDKDKIRAMLTPGEFVISKPAVDAYGARMMKDINNGTFKSGSVYNYSISVNVETDADAEQIANTVMRKIKSVDAKRIQGNRF